MTDDTSNQNISLTKEERKMLVLKAQEAKEVIFKLVVKIISWESGSMDSVVVKSANKITAKEWLKYKKHQLGISAAGSIQKTKDKIALTYKLIKENGGFEDK